MPFHPPVYRHVVRPALFRLGGGDAETAHERTLAALARLCRLPGLVAAGRRLSAATAPGLATTVFGVRFPSPVGLAAGMDKDGVALPAWAALGFGFVEVGTVTRDAQPGNPRPRLVRLPASGALVNRMGFNNAGAAALAARLAAEVALPVPLGVSLGKSKVTPVEDALADYATSLRLLHARAAYVAVNVSSPNTPGLRSLQGRDQLDALLGGLTGEAARLAPDRPNGRPVPLLVKVAPDLTEAAVSEVLEVCLARGVAGLVATNTTLSRAGVAPADARRAAAEAGGLSGRPLAATARRIVRFVVAETGGRLPVVGVGGISRPDDALALLDAGASLVQLYTGLVYEGPGLVRRTNVAVRRQRRGRVPAVEPPSPSAGALPGARPGRPHAVNRRGPR